MIHSRKIFISTLIILIFICNSCKQTLLLTVHPIDYTFELNDSKYYIEKIQILENGYKKKYEVTVKGSVGKSRISLLNLSKEYISIGSIQLLDSKNGNYEVNLYAINIDVKDSVYFTFRLSHQDSVPFEVRPFVLKP